jgi:hypothetical protein
MIDPRLGGLVVAALLSTACGDDGSSSGGEGGTGATGSGSTSTGNVDPDVNAGQTVIVAIVNPVVNDGHQNGVPDSLGDERDGVNVDAEPGGEDLSEDGIAVVDVAPGSIDLSVGEASLSVQVVAEGDVIDAPVAVTGDTGAFFDATPVRYAVGKDSGAWFFDPENELDEIRARLEEDDQVVVLGPGTYQGDLTISGSNVVIFGEGWSERAVTIDGSVLVQGTGVRLRGVTITGDLESRGNTLGISFSLVRGRTEIFGNASAFLVNVFCGGATVPSSNATLLENAGVAPITELPEGVCD